MRKGYGRDRIPKENPFWTLAKSLTNTWGGDDPDNTIFPTRTIHNDNVWNWD